MSRYRSVRFVSRASRTKKPAFQSVTRLSRVCENASPVTLFTLMKLSCAYLMPKYRSNRVPHCDGRRGVSRRAL